MARYRTLLSNQNSETRFVMNRINEIINNKLKTYPAGFGVDDIKIWLNDIPDIHSFSVFEPVFNRDDMTSKMWFALMIIIRNKYIDLLRTTAEYSNIHNLLDSYLKLEEINNVILDLSDFNDLNKIELYTSRKCETIILPKQSHLEFLEIINYPKLKRIINAENCTNLKFLAIRKCNQFIEFDFISRLNQLLVLDISLNKNLPSLEFLANVDSINILLLIDTNAIKMQDTVSCLSQLGGLRDLAIKANRSEQKLLREILLNCCINGLEPIDKEKQNN